MLCILQPRAISHTYTYTCISAIYTSLMSLTYYISWCLMSCINRIPRYHWCQIAAGLQISLMSMAIFVQCHSVSRELLARLCAAGMLGKVLARNSSLRTETHELITRAELIVLVIIREMFCIWSPSSTWGGGTWYQILQTGWCLTPVNNPQRRISVLATTEERGQLISAIEKLATLRQQNCCSGMHYL